MATKENKKIDIIQNPITDFRQRKTVNLNQSKIRYDLLKGLYRKTIVNKIITKFVQVSIPTFFTLHIEDEEGERLPELEKLVKPLNEKLNRRLFRDILRQSLLFGTSFLYTGNILNGSEVGDVFLLNQWQLKEKTDDNQKLIGWDYYSDNSSESVFIPYDNMVLLANDPDIGELYGFSICEPLLEFLNYFLNGAFGLATLIDGFALPLVLWSVEADDGEIANEVLINKIRSMLFEQLKAGDDVVLDSRIKPDALSFASDAPKIAELVREIRKNLGMVSIPESLLGGEAPNLNAIKIQLQMFYSDCIDFQVQINDMIVDNVYKPFLKSLDKFIGEDYSNIYINFPPPSLESNAEKIIWLREGAKLGFIDRALGRLYLGIRGKPPSDEEFKDYLEIVNGKQEQRSDQARDRSGVDPDNDPDANAEDLLDKLLQNYSPEELIFYIKDQEK